MTTINNVPAFLDWNVYQGDTARISVILRDESNEKMDLSDYSFEGQVRAEPKSTEVLQEITITKSDSLITLVIPNTTNLPRKSYFDIQSEHTDGTITTILKGNVNKEDDVTR